MNMLEWSADLSVSIAGIDRQHQQLIRLLNELHAAMQTGRGREMLCPALTRLGQYAETHFGFEERWFDECGYPDAAAHRREHAQFVRDLRKLKAGLYVGTATVTTDVCMFMAQWLQNHIKVTDKNYTEFLRARGLR